MSTDQHTGHGLGEGRDGDEITSCDDVLSHVFEFLDRETDDRRRAVIAEHLAAVRLVRISAAHAQTSCPAGRSSPTG